MRKSSETQEEYCNRVYDEVFKDTAAQGRSTQRQGTVVFWFCVFFTFLNAGMFVIGEATANLILSFITAACAIITLLIKRKALAINTLHLNDIRRAQEDSNNLFSKIKDEETK